MHHCSTVARKENILFRRESSADCVVSKSHAVNELFFFGDGRMQTELFPSLMHDSIVCSQKRKYFSHYRISMIGGGGWRKAPLF